MTKAQRWTTIILAFVLALTLIVGGYAYGSLKSIENILSSPAATSKIDVDADMWFEMSKEGKLELQSIHLKRIQAELNSKILDLIIQMAINNQ